MSGKRRADESDVDPLSGIEIGDEEMRALSAIQKEQERYELINERDMVKTLTPIWERRRSVIQTVMNFWSHALLNHPELGMYIQLKEDQDALSYLKEIHVARNPVEFRSYTIEFHFNENPYFSDTVLRKEYKYTLPPGASNDTPDEDGITPTMIDFDFERDVEPQATKISWKSESQNLVAKYPRRLSEEDEEDDDAMDISLEDRFGSFFNFFTDDNDPIEAGPNIADELYPEAIDFFFGTNLGGDDDSDVDDSEADDSDAEEIDLEAPPKRKPGRR